MTGGRRLAEIEALPSWIAPYGRMALGVGLAGALACAAGAFTDPVQFFRSYLSAYIFWLGIPLGCLAIMMLHHLSGGAWGVVIRRVLEAGSRTVPIMILLFVPLLFGLRVLYVWARPEVVAGDEILRHKSLYLNVPFFIVRAAAYFAIWAGLAWILNKWSREQDHDPDERMVRRFQLLSAPGLVAMVLTITFSSVDWLMSLEPHWFSTIYGALILVGDVLGAFAFVIAAVLWLSTRPPLSEVIQAVHLHDLGKLLFAFVMVWAYFAFSQFLIIWAGNLPEEIPYFLRRLQGGWEWVGIAIVVLHFIFPFMLLLPRATKRNTRLLMRVALLLVVMRFVDIYWMTSAAFNESLSQIHWMDVAAPVGLGGIWLWLFGRQLTRMPLLPLGDPWLQEALTHDEE
jgi:hypothetical protein